MKKTLSTLFAALSIGAMTAVPTAPACADSAGAAVAAGIGGLALGTIIGGAVRPAPPVVYPAPVYVEPAYRARPVYENCWRERRPVFDEYGEVIGYRPQRVCE